MQTRPKLLHYGLSWPISGAFTNPNCALAGRDCSIQTVCWEKKRLNSSPAMWTAIIYKIFISLYHMRWKDEQFPPPFRKAHFHGFYLLTTYVPAITSLECFKHVFHLTWTQYPQLPYIHHAQMCWVTVGVTTADKETRRYFHVRFKEEQHKCFSFVWLKDLQTEVGNLLSCFISKISVTAANISSSADTLV